MNDALLNQLIDAWRDDSLSDDQAEQLNQLLRESQEARRAFAAESRLHGLLHCAVEAGAVETVAAAANGQSPIPADPIERAPLQKKSKRNSPSILATGVVAALLLVIFAQWWFGNNTPAPALSMDPNLRLAEVRYERGADLAVQTPRNQKPATVIRVGSRLAPGVYTLDHGFVELDFFGGAVLAIESPASLELLSQREARLLKGRVTVEAFGTDTSFLLHTPIGEVLDIGTRYGVYVDESGATETHVFEGLVDIRPESTSQKARRVAANSAVRITPAGKLESLLLDEATFPQTSRQIDNLLQRPGFEQGTELHIGDTTNTGIWNGDVCQVVGRQGTIRPFAGQGMLLFQSTSKDIGNDQGQTKASQLSQWIDLTPWQDAILAGRVQAKLTAHFNRVAGDAQTDSQFSIHLESFEVAPDEARQLLESRRFARSRTSHQLISDSNPQSWEKLESVLTLPATSRSLQVTILAFENVEDDGETGAEFDGHFADDVRLQLAIEPASATVE